jgi:hypothetical protein
MTKQRHDPSPARIAAECARIRKTWDSQRNHKARYGEDELYERWEVPVIHLDDCDKIATEISRED